MTELDSICPVCDKDIKFMDGSIRRALMHKAKTAGKALVSCPNCCHVLVLNTIPTTGDADLEEWIAQYDSKKDNPDSLPCIPLLDPMDAKMPNGFVEHLNVRFWTPGDDTKAVPALDYMMKYGVDPALAWAMMGHR
jgi:hypothetical protein